MPISLKGILQSFVLICLVAVFSGCGGGGNSTLVESANGQNGNNGQNGDNNGDDDDSGDDDDDDDTQRLLFAVTGLSGSLTVNVDSRALTIRNNGNVSMSNLPAGALQATISSAPSQQRCLFASTESTSASLSSANTVTIRCEDLLTLDGSIFVAGTETPVAGVDVVVRAYDEQGNLLTEMTDTTGVDGGYLLEDIVIQDFERMTFTLDDPQYELFSLPISESPSTLSLTKNYSLTQPVFSRTFNPGSSQNMVLGDVSIALPANSLETGAGELPAEDVTVFVSALDPSFAPELFPGGYTRAGNEALETFGGVSLRFFSAGEELQFADGATATVQFPVANRAEDTAPDNGEVHYFDKTSGLWVSAGTATRPQPGYFEITANVSTVWGIFQPYDTILINGCVRDGDNRPVADTLVIAQGQEYIGRLLDYTDSSGRFSVPAMQNSSILLFARSDVASRTTVIQTETSNITRSECIIVDPDTTTITLSWGQNPSDLDSHLTGPDGTGSFRIYYVNDTQSVNGVTMYLDVDDTQSFGPEVVTLPSYPQAGTYSYYVHHFSGTSDMLNSPTRVALFTNGIEYVFNVDSTATTSCWHVFDIEVDDQLMPTVTEVDRFVNPSNCASS